ncbi:DNA-binding protein [Oceanobacillus sp. CAU 1775]
MDLDFLFLALGIAAAGYFIGEGLKNFKNPNAEYSLSELLNDDDDGVVLLKEKDVHYYIGISKEDTKGLIQQYPDIPHVIINDKVYYPKAKLRDWLKNLGE